MPSYGPNNRKQAETVARNRQIVVNVRDDDEAATLAAKRGRDAAALAAGIALADSFLKEYGDRDTATGNRTDARHSLRAQDTAARRQMGDLRSALRALYDGEQDDLERLGVARKDMAGDRDTFLTESRSTLAAVRLDPYGSAAEGVGFDKDAVDAVEAAVEDLATAAGGKTSASGRHIGETDERDASYAAFMKWMKASRRLFRLAFRDRPEVAARVGL